MVSHGFCLFFGMNYDCPQLKVNFIVGLLSSEEKRTTVPHYTPNVSAMVAAMTGSNIEY